MDTVIPGSFWQTLNKVVFVPDEAKGQMLEMKEGKTLRSLQIVNPLECEMLTEMFLHDKEKGKLLKLDRTHVRSAKVANDWDAEKDDLPRAWDIIYKGQWDSKFSEE